MYLEVAAIAVAVALSPIIISAFTRVAFGPQRSVAVPAYVVVVAVCAFAGTLLVAVGLGEATGGLDEDTEATVVSVAVAALLAVVLLVLAWRSWGKRGVSADQAASDAPGDAPGAVEDAEGPGLTAAAGLGAAVMLANPKSLALMFAAGDVIGVQATGPGVAASGAAVFAAVSAGPIGAVAIYQAVGGDGAEQRMVMAERWLTKHDAVIKTAFLVIFAAYFAAQAISGLGEL